jgi:hypothetical protein
MATTACTVEQSPGSPSSGTSAGAATPPAASSGTPRPCPWSEERGQEYEPETGRIRLVGTCLGDGGGWAYTGPDQRDGARQHRFTDGATFAVICVEPDGGRFVDSAAHASTVWFHVQGPFTGADGAGWVPHAATGYAEITGQDTC